jgi:hypothetical protein
MSKMITISSWVENEIIFKVNVIENQFYLYTYSSGKVIDVEKISKDRAYNYYRIDNAIRLKETLEWRNKR